MKNKMYRYEVVFKKKDDTEGLFVSYSSFCDIDMFKDYLKNNYPKMKVKEITVTQNN